MHYLKTLLSAGLLASLASARPTAAPRTAGNGEKLVVYWGAQDDKTTLMDVCKDPSYDIVNLAFLSYFHKAGGFPKLSISSLAGPSRAQKAAGALDLQDGTTLIPAINACQMAGKKVLLSLGGAVDYADSTFKSDGDAVEFADTLWDLFGGSNGTIHGTPSAPIRPFGTTRLDGFDLDNESQDSTGYLAFVNRMRSNFARDPTHQYYLTAAPQCSYPDKSVPLDVCSRLDYVWVQFYNNGACDVDQAGFEKSVKQWSEGIGSAKLVVGALADTGNGNKGYVPAATLAKKLKSVAAMGLKNYAGAMLWEAQMAVENGDYQKTIAAAL